MGGCLYCFRGDGSCVYCLCGYSCVYCLAGIGGCLYCFRGDGSCVYCLCVYRRGFGRLGFSTFAPLPRLACVLSLHCSAADQVHPFGESPAAL
jgi:hypothetical protein